MWRAAEHGQHPAVRMPDMQGRPSHARLLAVRPQSQAHQLEELAGRIAWAVRSCVVTAMPHPSAHRSLGNLCLWTAGALQLMRASF